MRSLRTWELKRFCRRTRYMKRFALAAALIVIAGCSSGNEAAEPGAATREGGVEQGLGTEGSTVESNGSVSRELALSGDYWATSITEDGESREIVEGTVISLGFADGEFRAGAGCDQLGGPFSFADSGELVIDRISMTFEGCEGLIDGQETFFIQVLRDRPTLQVGADTISLVTSTVTIEMLDVRIANPDRPLVGTSWELRGILRADGVRQSSAWFSIVQPMVFGSDSSVVVEDVCSGYVLDVEVAVVSAGGPATDNASGELSFPSSPPEPSEGCLEFRTTTLIRQVFEGEASYTIFGGRLEISGENGATLFFVEKSA